MPDVTDKPFVEQFKWRQLERVTAWRPKPGEQIAGYFRGLVPRVGQYGPYEVALVETQEFGLVPLAPY